MCAVLTLIALGLRAYGMGSVAALGNDKEAVERLLAREAVHLYALPPWQSWHLQ